MRIIDLEKNEEYPTPYEASKRWDDNIAQRRWEKKRKGRTNNTDDSVWYQPGFNVTCAIAQRSEAITKEVRKAVKRDTKDKEIQRAFDYEEETFCQMNFWDLPEETKSEWMISLYPQGNVPWERINKRNCKWDHTLHRPAYFCQTCGRWNETHLAEHHDIEQNRKAQRCITKTVFDYLHDNEEYTEQQRIRYRQRMSRDDEENINWPAAPGPGDQRTKWTPGASRWAPVERQVGGITSSRGSTPRSSMQQTAEARRDQKQKPKRVRKD